MYERPTRFLTDEEKAANIITLGKEWMWADHEFGEGLDIAMYPWLIEINNIPGVATIASCEGHPRGDNHNLAMLMLRFNETFAQKVKDTVWRLVYDLPYDPHAEYLWMTTNGVMSEHLVLSWEGLSYHHSLGPVLEPVLAWLKGLASRNRRPSMPMYGPGDIVLVDVKCWRDRSLVKGRIIRVRDMRDARPRPGYKFNYVVVWLEGKHKGKRKSSVLPHWIIKRISKGKNT